MADIDDCEHICIDTIGSFECSCHDGYTLSSDGRSCVDTNECTVRTHNCQQVCVNISMGDGFRCECNVGYQLNSDQRTCSGKLVCMCMVACVCCIVTYLFVDVDECANNTGGCEHELCSNNDGSFTCSCRNGYRLDSNGRSCIGKLWICNT